MIIKKKKVDSKTKASQPSVKCLSACCFVMDY